MLFKLDPFSILFYLLFVYFGFVYVDSDKDVV